MNITEKAVKHLEASDKVVGCGFGDKNGNFKIFRFFLIFPKKRSHTGDTRQNWLGRCGDGHQCTAANIRLSK